MDGRAIKESLRPQHHAVSDIAIAINMWGNVSHLAGAKCGIRLYMSPMRGGPMP